MQELGGGGIAIGVFGRGRGNAGGLSYQKGQHGPHHLARVLPEAAVGAVQELDIALERRVDEIVHQLQAGLQVSFYFLHYEKMQRANSVASRAACFVHFVSNCLIKRRYRQ